MDKTIYKLPELEKIIKEQKYRFCSLLNLEGETVVPFNTIKGQHTITSKLKEINTRVKRLPAGVYCMLCKDVYGSGIAGDKYYVGIGKYDPNSLGEISTIQDKKTYYEKSPVKTSSEKLLSIEQAMDNLRELSDVKSENARLKAENERLKEENAELLEELEEEPEEEESSLSDGFTGIANTFKEMLPALEPLAEKFFSIKEKELSLKQAKFMAENGYEIPGMKKAVNGARKVKEQVQEQPEEVPEIGGNGWAQYINVLCNMEEAQFNQHLEQLKQHAPETYEAVCKEVYTEEEEETEDNG